MPAGPPATTNIVFADYNGPMGRHTVQCRFEDGASPGASVEALATYLNTAPAALWSTLTSVEGYRWQAKGSNITLPVDAPFAVTGTVSGTAPLYRQPQYVSVSGRGQEFGRQVRMFFYGLDIDPEGDYRLTSEEGVEITRLWTALTGLVAAGGFRTSKGDAVVVHPYANLGFNAYYQRKARSA